MFNSKSNHQSPKETLYKQHKRAGIIEVFEENRLRSLQFGTSEKQSTMYVDDPNQLILPYTQTMMISLLLKTVVNKVLILGLGGGSIAKFIFKNYPNCQIDILEKSETVVDIAYRFFYLPQDRRINVLIGDAAKGIKKGGQVYDIIFIDLFDQHGLAASAQSYSFTKNCYKHLKNGGVAVFNLWTEPKIMREKLNKIMVSCFENNVYRLPTPSGNNQIIFGKKAKAAYIKPESARCKLKSLKGIKYVESIKQLQRFLQINENVIMEL